MGRERLNACWCYKAPAGSGDGCMTGLLPRLAVALSFDGMSVVRRGTVNSLKPATLLFRRGAKRIFYVRLVRKTGRFMVELGGGEPAEVLRAVSVCRDHFDCWFGVKPTEIK